MIALHLGKARPYFSVSAKILLAPHRFVPMAYLDNLKPPNLIPPSLVKLLYYSICVSINQLH